MTCLILIFKEDLLPKGILLEINDLKPFKASLLEKNSSNLV